MIELRFCRIEYTDFGARTHFNDGTHVDAVPHPEMPHYIRVAADCGYDNDTMAYSREHEVAHSMVAEWFESRESHVLFCLAHKLKPDPVKVTYEELAAQTLQRWIRKNDRPIISGVDWDGLRRWGLEVLGSLDTARSRT